MKNTFFKVLSIIFADKNISRVVTQNNLQDFKWFLNTDNQEPISYFLWDIINISNDLDSAATFYLMLICS